MPKYEKLALLQRREIEDVINDSESSGREVRRAQAVLLLDQRTDIETIIALTQYSRRQIYDLRKNYLNQGISIIKDRKKGKPRELLTKFQRDEIIKIVKDKTPRDYDYETDYWTTSILGDFIEQHYKVKFKSKTSLYLIFKQAKFTYHKPGRVYEKRDSAEVQLWKETTKIKVKEALKEPNTVILTADEMSLSTQTTIQKVWLPQGEYPKIEVSNKKESRSIYGFLNIKDGKEHAFKTNWQNMYITCDVLKKLRKIYPVQKILLIWDKAPWHKGSKVTQFIKEDSNIETLDFPRAAPEENPQEHIWKAGRSKVSHNEFIANIDHSTDKFIDYLNNTKFEYSFLGFSANS